MDTDIFIQNNRQEADLDLPLFGFMFSQFHLISIKICCVLSFANYFYYA